MKLELKGARELERALFELKSATAKGVATRVLKKAAEPVAEAAAQKAPVRTGDLQGSIAISTRLNRAQRREAGLKKQDVTVVHVGPDRGLGKGGRHGHLLEFGTIKMPAQPFMRPAWEETKDEALKSVTENMRIEVGKSAARARRKAAKG